MLFRSTNKVSHHVEAPVHGYLELCVNKKERILQPNSRNAFASRKATSFYFIEGLLPKHKRLKSNLQGIQLYSHGEVEDFSRCVLLAVTLILGISRTTNHLSAFVNTNDNRLTLYILIYTIHCRTPTLFLLQMLFKIVLFHQM